MYTNPADHLLDIITSVNNDFITANQNTYLFMKQLTIDLNMNYDTHDVQMNNLPLGPSWNKQVRILIRRNFQEQRYSFQVIIVSFIQSIIMAILIGTMFYQIGHSQLSVFRRESILFSCVVNQSLFGALMIINSFPIERTLTLRERASGTYCASAYFTAKTLTETLVQLPVPIVFVSLLSKFEIYSKRIFNNPVRKHRKTSNNKF